MAQPRKQSNDEGEVSLFDHPNLTVFKQHGFTPSIPSGNDHVIGKCIFCGSEGHHTGKFYVNVESKKWDCKHCMKSGGYQKFLREVVTFGEENTDPEVMRLLAENRGFRVSTLRAHGVGYNPVSGAYTIPIWDIDNEELQDVKMYKNGKLHSSAGCKVGLYCGDILNLSNAGEFDTVWLVEGEWDRMAMWEILTRLKITNEVVVSVPGAGTFKTEWIPLFHGKKIRVVYDNDHDRELKNGKIVKGAGKLGAIKVYNMLKGGTTDIKFVHWNDSYKSGFDLRDYYTLKELSPRRTYNSLQNLLNEHPKDFELTAGFEQSLPASKRFTGEGCPITEVYKVFNKYLLMKNNNIIDATFATIIGNRLPGDPLWLFLVGPSGSGKSEIIMSLNTHKEIEAISSLTPHTLISGANFSSESDPSLIPRLNGKVLTVKDFTTIMGMNQTAQAEIISQLRDAYDGECAKPFGNGRFVKYESKFGIIAGVTGMIDVFSDGLTALGERFIKFIVPVDKSLAGERKVLQRVAFNMLTGGKENMQTDLRSITEKFLNFDFGDPPTVPDEIAHRVISLAQWAGMMRGSIIRDQRSQEISYKPMAEYCTRLTSQFIKLIRGLGMVHKLKEVTEHQYDIVKYVATCTAPTREEEMVRKIYLMEKSAEFNMTTLTEILGLPSLTTKKIAENLTMLGILQKRKLEKMDSNGNRTMWALTKEFIDLLEDARIYS